jgi:hypothetical protein
MSFTLLVFIVAAYSVIQSIFGVGVLVFGTPTLLLLGVPFQQAIGWLLPCSIMINFLQLLTDWRTVTLKRSFSVYFIVFAALGLAFVLSTGRTFNFKLAIGVLLLITAVLRLSTVCRAELQKFFNWSKPVSLSVIGLIHGMTNMGGGLLTIFVSSIFKEKAVIRANVAFGYLILACTQCAVLAYMRPSVFQLNDVILASVAGLTYLTLGRRVYDVTTNRAYQSALTAFILAFGIILIV